MQSLIGCYVKPDGWNIGEKLIESNGYSDSDFPGCQYRLPSTGGDLAVNIAITGRKSTPVPYQVDGLGYRTRVRVEFVGDGTLSTFTHGYVVTDYPLIDQEQ